MTGKVSADRKGFVATLSSFWSMPVALPIGTLVEMSTGVESSPAAAPPARFADAVPRSAIGASDDIRDLELVGAGDPTAIASLYDRHSAAVFGLALRITKDGGFAEDVVQATFVGVWRHAARYDPARATARTWIMAIAHHRAVDVVRRRRAAMLSLDAENGVAERVLAAPDVWAEVSGRFDLAAVTQALSTLPEAQRQSLELAYFGGMTQSEIASTTGVPLGTVKGRVRLGLLRLRDLLSTDFEGELANNTG